MDKKSLISVYMAASRAKQHCKGSRGEPEEKVDREVGESKSIRCRESQVKPVCQGGDVVRFPLSTFTCIASGTGWMERGN